MNKDQIIFSIIIMSMIIIGLIFTYFQWIECRDNGFSLFYCIKHID